MSNFLDNFPPDIREEIEQEDYLNLQHGRPNTYNMGCRGPLCRKANRESVARKVAKRRAERGLPPTNRTPEACLPRARDAELNLFLELYLVWRTTTQVA